MFTNKGMFYTPCYRHCLVSFFRDTDGRSAIREGAYRRKNWERHRTVRAISLQSKSDSPKERGEGDWVEAS